MAAKIKQKIYFGLAQGLGGRENQEDHYAVWSDGTVIGSEGNSQSSGRSRSELYAIVCDGMGGHNAGEYASHLAVTGFLKAVKPPNGGSSASLVDACNSANTTLARQIERDHSLDGMGTTLLGIRVAGSLLSWVSVGDSVLYLLRNGEISRLNADHSMRPVIEQMVLAKIIAPEDAASHPERNALRSALSGDKLSLIDRGEPPMSLRKRDVLLVASDGLDTLPVRTIGKFLKSRIFSRPATIARRLVAACMRAGGSRQDNTTVIVLKVS